MGAPKTCTGCGVEKPLSEFAPDKKISTGLSARCKQCVSEYSRAWYERNNLAQWDTGPLTLDCQHCGTEFTYVKTTGPRKKYCTERCRMQAGSARQKAKKDAAARVCECGSTEVPMRGKPQCVECRKGDRKRAATNQRRRLSLYGMSESQFGEMLALQRGQCAVCATEDPGVRGWQIDHDHACCPGIGSCGNCVRGILCHQCNLLLGHAKDSIVRLDQAKKYLQSNSQFKLRVVN